MVIPVKIEVTSENGRLMAGVSANAEILIQESQDALAVPVDALLSDPALATSTAYFKCRMFIRRPPIVCGMLRIKVYIIQQKSPSGYPAKRRKLDLSRIFRRRPAAF